MCSGMHSKHNLYGEVAAVVRLYSGIDIAGHYYGSMSHLAMVFMAHTHNIFVITWFIIQAFLITISDYVLIERNKKYLK